MKIAESIIKYLTNWKNLLVHSVTGIAILIVTLYAPLPMHARIAVPVAAIAFNIYRMKKEKKEAI